MKTPVARIDLTSETCEMLARIYRERYVSAPETMIMIDLECALLNSDRIEITALRWEK